jgi:hypothetical protein
MFLYLPESFNINEWFIIIGVILNILTFKLLPKKIPKAITPLIVLLSISFPKVLDHTIAVVPIDLYNINDSKNYELFDLILYAVYPMFGYLFIYLVEVLKPRGIMFVLYFIAWDVFAVIFEFFLNKLHVFNYNGWNIIFSLPVYLITLCFTYIFYIYTINLNKKLVRNSEE